MSAPDSPRLADQVAAAPPVTAEDAAALVAQSEARAKPKRKRKAKGAEDRPGSPPSRSPDGESGSPSGGEPSEAAGGGGSEPPEDDDLDGFEPGGGPPQPPDGDGVDAATVAWCAALEQNDTDNGQRLLAHFGDDLLHVREIGWHSWCGTHWEADGGSEAVERAAQRTAKRIHLEADALAHTVHEERAIEAGEKAAVELEAMEKRKAEWDEREKFEALRLKIAVDDGRAAREALKRRRVGRRKFAISCGNRARTVAMIAQALPHRTVAPAAVDADPMLFNVENGTLRFSRERLRDLDCPDPDAERFKTEARVELVPAHDPAHLITHVAPYPFDPAARCPRWDAFLARFQPDAEQRRYFQTAAGRGLLGGASTQVLIFLYGDGANGKSVAMEVLCRVLAGYAGRLKPESITGTMEQGGDKATPDFARLHRKRFVAIAELPRGAPLREGLVKTVTGSEPMPVRHLNRGFFDMTPEFVPFMSGNQLPDVSGLDRGIWRRLKFLRWPVTLGEAEQRQFSAVVDEFMEEASGILNWLVAGALRFLEEGLVDPPQVRDLVEEHRADSDPVGAFTRDCVRPVGAGVQARAMYEAFVSYCMANAIRPWKEKAFSLALKQKGFRREDKRLRTWLDVELVDVPPRPDDPRNPSQDGFDGLR